MNPLRILVLIVTLPLLLGGCGEKHEGVNAKKLEFIGVDGIVMAYFKGSETPYTGKVYSLHPNGQKKKEGNFKEGKTDGLLVRWHKNGQKETEGNYKDGKADGLFVEWYENGQKLMKGNFKDGKFEGLQMAWHENEQKKWEAIFKDGEKISEKFWNSKDEPVDSLEEAEK